jgi:hypothetical protein
VVAMTIGEVRSKLELNYNKHYENVKTYYYISTEKAVKYIQEQTGCEAHIADQVVREWMNNDSNVEYRNPYNNKTIEVKCPYCNSLKTSKISELSKVGRFALWGIFSLSKNSKQWHCNNCKSDF